MLLYHLAVNNKLNSKDMFREIKPLNSINSAPGNPNLEVHQQKTPPKVNIIPEVLSHLGLALASRT